MGSIPGNTGLSSCSHDWQEKLCIPIVTVVARNECFAGEQESPCIKLAEAVKKHGKLNLAFDKAAEGFRPVP